MAQLNTGVRYIKGIGEKRAKALSKLGIETLYDLVTFFPRGYEDRRRFKRLNELTPGETVCVKAIAAQNPKVSHIRKGMDIVKVRVVDETASLELTFFNQTYVKDSIKAGESYCFYGKIGGTLLRPEMTNPVFEPEDAGRITGKIMPLYHLTAGVTQTIITRAVRDGLTACGDVLPDPLPETVQNEYRLARSRYAYENIHFPESFEALEIARRRLVFEELFVLASAMRLMRNNTRKHSCSPLDGKNIDKFYEILPFEVTKAQKNAISDVIGDLKSDTAMSRLVQGDVGSGKTVVAVAGCWFTCTAGGQCAVMAPTEILAEQHFDTFKALLEPFGITVELLCGSFSAPKKRKIKERLANGDIDVIVGTHALLSEDVKFKSLAFAVTDEQHRFGVDQRAALASKGDYVNILVMSATPIPRTLAMIIYGDLDISVIDEMPPGRTPVETFAVGEHMRPRVNAFIKKLVDEGRQAYIVCPMVEETELLSDGVKSAVKYTQELRENKIFAGMRIELIHGKMKAAEKEKVMRSFSAGDIDILVSTTVIEVGVDVPNAALMVIENADRFGLSQLHQLRGRVGRGKHKSYCIMFDGGGGEIARRRLKVLCGTNDGFKISEEDLRLRGPGDFFGSRQHGLPELKIANFAENMDVLTAAKAASDKLLDKDPHLDKPENARLRAYVKQMIENCVTG